MAKVTYISSDGASYLVDIAPGISVMEGATNNSVPGITADCGGACACATCKIVIADDWVDAVGPASEMEAAMLDLEPDDNRPFRLSCQVKVSDELDGLIVHVPESQ